MRNLNNLMLTTITVEDRLPKNRAMKKLHTLVYSAVFCACNPNNLYPVVTVIAKLIYPG